MSVAMGITQLDAEYPHFNKTREEIEQGGNQDDGTGFKQVLLGRYLSLHANRRAQLLGTFGAIQNDNGVVYLVIRIN